MLLFEKSLVSSPGIEVALDNMPNDGVILVVTDSGSKQLELEKSIRKKSLEKNLKIYFSFSPSCRADCGDSLPVYKRISDGRLFNESDFTSETFFRTVVFTVCHHSAGFQYTCNDLWWKMHFLHFYRYYFLLSIMQVMHPCENKTNTNTTEPPVTKTTKTTDEPVKTPKSRCPEKPKSE